MANTDDVLRAAVTGEEPTRTLTLDAAFQGLPDIAHGGSVLALFDALASIDGSRRATAHYRRRVPVGMPLVLTVAADGPARTFAVRDGAGVLVTGRLATHEASRGAADAPATKRLDGGGETLPVSRTCFACGTDNVLGLRARLAADDAQVVGTWTPRAAFAGHDGRLAPVALTTLLDEAAFWLGALATGEAGLTTELTVTLCELPAFGEPVTVVGDRAAVRAHPADARYCDTRVAAVDSRGRLLADATITFVAVRGAARRLVTGLLAINSPETLRRVFPAYTRP